MRWNWRLAFLPKLASMTKPIVIYGLSTFIVSGFLALCLGLNGLHGLNLAIDEAFGRDPRLS